MAFYVVGDDKSLVDVTELVLALTGGTMTGNIAYKGSRTTNSMIRFIDNDINGEGNGISIGDGGITIIAAGEIAAQVESEYNPNNENVVIAADSAIDFYTNCQNGLSGAAKVTLSKAGLLSGHQKAITSGTAAPSGGSNGDIYIQY